MPAETGTHSVTYLIEMSPGGDTAAMGGAVTVALCGHWDHEGPCRWPHFSSVSAVAGDIHRLVVEFTAPEDEREQVQARIDAAVHGGEQAGPDGHISRWSVRS